MDGSKVTEGVYIRYWHPANRKESGREATTIQDVINVATQAFDEYRDAGVGFLPGVSLWRGADIPENSLSVGIAPDGWAIIHTDEEFFQRVTRGPGKLTGVRRKVQLDDFLEIPSVCFIPKELAIETIEFWLSSGGLLKAAGFSEDLFTA